MKGILRVPYLRLALVLGLAGPPFAARAESVFTGTTDNSWNVAANWSPQGVPQATDDVSIPAGKSVVATGDIVCRDLNLAGNLTLGASVVRELDSSARANVSLTAEGDITLSGSAKLTVYAGQLADLSVLAKTVSAGDLQAALYAHANVVSAKGTMTFGAGTTVVPNNDDVSGTPVIFRATDITVAAGATVNAIGGGWGWFRQTSPDPATRSTPLANRHTYAPGYGSGYSDGGSYGGKGGGSTARTYGFSFAPLMPGSPGGIQKGVVNGSRGGGTICLQASQALTVQGTLTAVGYKWEETTRASGGAIWLCGHSVDYASAVKICADGESTTSTTPWTAGGGGRIAICEGMTTPEFADMASGTSRGEVLALSLANVTANGGTNGDGTRNGSDGTVVHVVNTSMVSHVRIETPGVPALAMEGLSYGEEILPAGTKKTYDVPERAFLAADPGNERYAYAGYIVSNATAQVGSGGASARHIEFDLETNKGPYVVYLNWTNREVRRGFVSAPSAYGTFKLNGTDVGSSFEIWSLPTVEPTSVITFVPASGVTFLGWSGSYPRAHTLGNPATCTSTNRYGLTVRVKGCTAAGESVSWTGGAGYWDDAAKWSGGKVPTLLDDVTIATGVVTARESFVAKSLTLTGGTLAVGELGSTTNFFGTVAGDVTLSGTAVLGVQGFRPPAIDRTTQQTYQTDLYDQAGTIRIEGAFTVGAGTTVQIANDPLTGLPVVFRPGSLTVETNGTVTAAGGGFGWVVKTDAPIFADAYTARFNNSSVDYATYGYSRGSGYGGAGYGGKATAAYPATGIGCAYGFEDGPLFPGSPAGLSFWQSGKVPVGGGTVCVFAEDGIAVNGTVSAVGAPNGAQGGCSGGAIWLAGTSVTLGDAASVTADGNGCQSVNAGAGGGGRILFAIAASSAMLDQLVDGTATPASLELTKTAISSTLVTVAGGVNQGSVAKGAADGTRYQIYDPNATTTMTTTADPVEYLADGVVYGSSSVNYGKTFSMTAPDWSYNTTDRTDSRFAYAGYVASNATAQVASGTEADPSVSVSFVKPNGPYELRFKWGARETYHVVTVTDGTVGSVTLNGEAYVSGTPYWRAEESADTITAVPAAGYEFVCWRGDVPRDLCRSETIEISAATATRITPVFRLSAATATYHWKKNAVGEWFDAANWDEGNFPWVGDDAVIASGTCTIDSAFEVNSLIVTNGASLTIGDSREVIVSTDLTVVSTNTSLRIVSAAADETSTLTNGATRVRVAGAFTVTDYATFYPESEEVTGGSPVILCDRFTLAENAKIDAVSLGYGGPYSDGKLVNLCPGGSGGPGSSTGGGYGGLGELEATCLSVQSGLRYGLALTPIHPGAPNGVRFAQQGDARRGGGLVRIHAVRKLTIDGTVDASASNTSIYSGASGGGIWLTGEKQNSVSFGPKAQLLANGGYSVYQGGYGGIACGGGGRIAVGQLVSEELRMTLIETGRYPGEAKKMHLFDEEGFLQRYPGVTISVKPGAAWSSDPDYCGTFNFIDMTEYGFIFLVR